MMEAEVEADAALDAVLENRLLSGWAANLPRSARQVNQPHEADAELVRLGDGRLLAATVDAIDEELRFGLYREPATVGHLAAIASLSDLAAVGAEPLGLLLAVTLPENAEEARRTQRELARGLAEVARQAGTFVLGGDTSLGAALSISCTGLGIVPEGEALLRVGARPGDLLYASGPLGDGAAFAVAKLLDARTAPPEDTFRPPLRLAHGRALRRIGRVCMDTSDGLIATLDQLARLNRLAVEVEAPLDQLLSSAAREVGARLALTPFELLAACHGEFELVFAVPPERRGALDRAARGLGWDPVPIGRFVQGSGLRAGGREIDGAAVRNAFGECGDSLQRYQRVLRTLGP